MTGTRAAVLAALARRPHTAVELNRDLGQPKDLYAVLIDLLRERRVRCGGDSPGGSRYTLTGGER